MHKSQLPYLSYRKMAAGVVSFGNKCVRTPSRETSRDQVWGYFVRNHLLERGPCSNSMPHANRTGLKRVKGWAKILGTGERGATQSAQSHLSISVNPS